MFPFDFPEKIRKPFEKGKAQLHELSSRRKRSSNAEAVNVMILKFFVNTFNINAFSMLS